MDPKLLITDITKNNKTYYKIRDFVPEVTKYSSTDSKLKITTDLNGFLHSYNDEPAITSETYNEWYDHGRLHRSGKPAHIPTLSSPTIGGYIRYSKTSYFHYGKRHRIGGPAIIDHSDNSETWYYKGQKHRIGGPAITNLSSISYYSFGSLHREDGPALIIKHISKTIEHFYIQGCKLTKEEFDKWKINNFIKKSI